MKRHLIFCCNPRCADFEIRDLVAVNPGAKITLPDRILTAGDNEYWFMVDANSRPEMIAGLEFNTYRTCGRYDLSREIIEYLEAHKRREP